MWSMLIKLWFQFYQKEKKEIHLILAIRVEKVMFYFKIYLTLFITSQVKQKVEF